MRAYKFLDADGRAPFTGVSWNRDRWVDETAASACRVGVHACRPADLAYWLGATLWEVDIEGVVVESGHKVVASRGRLVRRIDDYPVAVRELAEVGAWRSHDRGLDALRRQVDRTGVSGRRPRRHGIWPFRRRPGGVEGLFETVSAVTTLDELAALGDDVDDSTFEGKAVALAADAADRAGWGMASASPFAAAYSAGHAAAADDDDRGVFDRGYIAERAFQSSWLAERLGLDPLS